MKDGVFFFYFINKMNSETLLPIRIGSFQKHGTIDTQYKFKIQECSFSKTIATSKVPHTNKYYTTREPDNEIKNIQIQHIKKNAPITTRKTTRKYDSTSISSLTQTVTIPKRNAFKEMSLAAKK